MKKVYFDCGMGASGDMIGGALLDLVEDKDTMIQRLNGLCIPHVSFSYREESPFGIKMIVEVHGEEEHVEDMDHHHNHDHHHDHDHHHHHHHHGNGIREVMHHVDHMPISENTKNDIRNVFMMIAEAEGHVHHKTPNEIHFHEVGTMDAIADVTAACILMNQLHADEIVVSPIHVGSGRVKCAHGVLPVPAPATAYILKDVPVYGGAINGELCTPTGAAILKYYADRFEKMPSMTIKQTGYGMGTKKFEEAVNCLTVYVGETEKTQESITLLHANIDDMTGEELGFAQEMIWESGAVDVYTTPIFMKKNRPGVMLSCICKPEKKEACLDAFLRYTTTLGVRMESMERYVLDRRVETLDIEGKQVRIKTSDDEAYPRQKVEYEDLRRIAKERNLSLKETLKYIGK